MPREHGVEAVEYPVARHVGLAADVFLGRRAIEAHRALQLAGRDLLLDRDRGAEARGAKHVVAAAMTGARPASGSLLGLAFCERPGSASYSPMIPITGRPLP